MDQVHFDQSLPICIALSAIGGVLEVIATAVTAIPAVREKEGRHVPKYVQFLAVAGNVALQTLSGFFSALFATWYGPVSIVVPFFYSSTLLSNMLIFGILLGEKFDKNMRVGTNVIVIAVILLPVVGPDVQDGQTFDIIIKHWYSILWFVLLMVATIWTGGILVFQAKPSASSTSTSASSSSSPSSASNGGGGGGYTDNNKQKQQLLRQDDDTPTTATSSSTPMTPASTTTNNDTSNKTSNNNNNNNPFLHKYSLQERTMIIAICRSASISIDLTVSRCLILGVTSNIILLTLIVCKLLSGNLYTYAIIVQSYAVEQGKVVPLTATMVILVNALTGIFIWEDWKVVQSWYGYGCVFVLLGLGCDLLLSVPLLHSENPAFGNAAIVLNSGGSRRSSNKSSSSSSSSSLPLTHQYQHHVPDSLMVDTSVGGGGVSTSTQTPALTNVNRRLLYMERECNTIENPLSPAPQLPMTDPSHGRQGGGGGQRTRRKSFVAVSSKEAWKEVISPLRSRTRSYDDHHYRNSNDSLTPYSRDHSNDAWAMFSPNHHLQQDSTNAAIHPTITTTTTTSIAEEADDVVVTDTTRLLRD